MFKFLSARKHNEDGYALATVIGVAAVIGLIAALLVSATAVNTTNTTSTRANVQAVAAAEAGIDAVRSAIFNGNCVSPTFESTTNPEYHVEVYSSLTGEVLKTGANFRCPTIDDRGLLLVSTGYAADKGFNSERGDSAVVEALLSISDPPPTFDHAVFIGDGDTQLTNNWSLTRDENATGTGALVSGGDVECNSGAQSDLPVIVNGNLRTSNNCTFKGDVFVSGNVTQCQGLIKGDLHVQGSITGHVSCKVEGSIFVKNSMSGGFAGEVVRDLVITNGTLSGWTSGKIGGKIKVATDIPSRQDLATANIGGVACSYSWGNPPGLNACANNIEINPSMDPPLEPAGGFNEVMPALKASELIESVGGGSTTTWVDFVRNQYAANNATVGKTNPADKFSNPNNTCAITAPTNPVYSTGGDHISGPLNTPLIPAVIDARGQCGTVTLREATLVVNSNTVLLVDNFTMTNGVKFVRGAGVPASVTPAVYIVVPTPETATSCESPIVNNTISVMAGATSDPGISVMFYSAGDVAMSNSFAFNGQLYTCRLGSGHNSINVNYTTVGQGSTDQLPYDFDLRYLRDMND